MILYDEKGQEVNIVNYTKATNQDVPYESVWSIREEVNGNFKTQWATNQKGTDGYKRTFNGSTWNDWLLVEGECKLWEGHLKQGQSINLPRLTQFNKFRLHVEGAGLVTCHLDNGGINGVTFWNTNGINYLSYADLSIVGTTIKNDACGYSPVTSLVSGVGSNYQLTVIEIVGII